MAASGTPKMPKTPHSSWISPPCLFITGTKVIIFRSFLEKTYNFADELFSQVIMKAITRTDFNFPGQTAKYSGKVRDVYSIGNEYLIMVATDRISAFDVVLPRGIPRCSTR